MHVYDIVFLCTSLDPLYYRYNAEYVPPEKGTHWLEKYVHQLEREAVEGEAASRHLRVLGSEVRVPGYEAREERQLRHGVDTGPGKK